MDLNRCGPVRDLLLQATSTISNRDCLRGLSEQAEKTHEQRVERLKRKKLYALMEYRGHLSRKILLQGHTRGHTFRNRDGTHHVGSKDVSRAFC